MVKRCCTLHEEKGEQENFGVPSAKGTPNKTYSGNTGILGCIWKVKNSEKPIIPVFCKILDLVAIITQYYRNVNNKIQKTEIAMEYRYRNTPQKPANIKTLRRTVQCCGRRESRV